MNESETVELIGGPFCHDKIDPGLIPTEDQVLTEHEREVLWQMFEEIGRCWENVFSPRRGVYDSSNLRSSWLEFIEAKTTHEPSYVAEYSNAVTAIEELVDLYGREDAHKRLFLENGIEMGPPLTRIAHAKRYVVDEFIRLQVVASGHKAFGGANYAGYIGGSRYTLSPRVRAYRPDKEQD
ncbi:MAG: hypothetical protein MI923_02970 [Phycisphaerales bacterium]|nr:hypothetical protein [Phycisphaerales bacterium]